jgi:hypothetical protein
MTIITADTDWHIIILRWTYLVFEEGLDPVCYWIHSGRFIGVQALEMNG